MFRWSQPCPALSGPSLSPGQADLHPSCHRISETERQSHSILHHPHTNTVRLRHRGNNPAAAAGVGHSCWSIAWGLDWDSGPGWHTNYWCKNSDKNLTQCQKCSIIRQSWFIIKDDKLNGQNGWKTVFCRKFLPFNHKTVLSAAAQAGLIRPLKCRAFNYSQRNSRQIFLFY